MNFDIAATNIDTGTGNLVHDEANDVHHCH